MKKGRKSRDIRGKKFGKLSPISIVDWINKEQIWLCKCDCGRQVAKRKRLIVSGLYPTCGSCTDKSGYNGSRITREYKAWTAIKQRCFNPKNPGYASHIKKGVTMCARWSASFSCFLADMGEAPPGSRLYRIDTCAGYDKYNCIYALPSVIGAIRGLLK